MLGVGGDPLIPLLALLAFLVGLFFLRSSQLKRSAMGLPNGDVFYQDHSGQPMRAVNLHSAVYGLTGKPDCLIRTPEGIVPVELKRTARPPARGEVYDNHLIQVLAYIVMVREHYREPVPYGLVVYAGQTARKVYPTPENIEWLLSVARQLRAGRRADALDRDHRRPGRCNGCGLKEKCGQSLAV